MSFSNNFLPSAQIIQDITNANPAVITTQTSNGYDDSLLVRIVLPDPGNELPEFGMNQLNNQVFQITTIDDVNFSIPIDTTSFQPFTPVIEPAPAHQFPQVIPVAETGYVFNEAVKNNRNIAPEI